MKVKFDAAPVLRKLSRYGDLREEDLRALRSLLEEFGRLRGTREQIGACEDGPCGIRFVLSGWACRYKSLEDGRRQIVAFLLPGEVCDVCHSGISPTDSAMATLTPVVFSEVPQGRFEALLHDFPTIARALWRETAIDMSIQREWTLNVGQRHAYERLAHLLCEIFLRLDQAGLTSGITCEFPMTQCDLADATGLSVVHVNRTLQELRSENLISLQGKTLSVPNLQRLQSAALFDTAYLYPAAADARA